MVFIGQQRREFRFDLRYRALTGYGRKELEKAVEDDPSESARMGVSTLFERYAP
ncbi:hypothetical protein [Arthrobacter sp. Soil762]|uniref:hypothetical protein n=1 Tax=Arthrobacter sp. Soil762 TaxID=1736401 RepID=UPI001F3FFB6E|nr:hypothetical protein [Arthrobacter sp. Soil762]